MAQVQNGQGPRRLQPIGPRYKWIALSNTTLGILMATINASIVLISLPAIFHGIGINPLAPGETNYLLWMLLGYMVVTTTLVVSLGRISDMFGRVRLYNLGFAIFTVGSVLLFITPGSGNTAATEMIIFRVIQAIGGSFLMANSTAILIDAFPIKQRGTALGINQMLMSIKNKKLWAIWDWQLTPFLIIPKLIAASLLLILIFPC